ncbi:MULTISPECIES: shikimate dehydrogenase [unclassified Crossiella]|uniref:shikimate dehydrogenase n=1 Tax=unclassified Crossiella TaxID=2620835 RepID=UPI0027E520DB|nr:MULTISPECIES: shikimate dehydrogenase [unclassified Crossiella]
MAPTDPRRADPHRAGAPRRAAILGAPVAHSLSPVLHNAAFTALGLTGWHYERIECDEQRLPALLAEATQADPPWAGFSVTMPGKRLALDLATEATERARLVGAANTLTPLPEQGWRADCTDVDGVTGALRAAGGITRLSHGHATILGAGGTALAAIVALAELGLTELTLAVRDPARATDAVDCAARVGLKTETILLSEANLAHLAANTQVLVSTVPPAATEPHATALAAAPCVLDVIYHPFPTPLATAVLARGNRLATGLDMLLHQAFGQSEQFTGQPAPREAMRTALRAATDNLLELPL